MKLNEIFSVSPSKVEQLKARMDRLGIDPGRIDEQFTRGSGKGGQKRNKTSNVVVLRYDDIVVKMDRERQRNLNRFLALRELVDRIEMQVSPGTSARIREWRRTRKQKDRRARRSEKPAALGGDS